MSRFKHLIAHDPMFGYFILFMSMSIFFYVIYRLVITKTEDYEDVRNLPLEQEENKENIKKNKDEK